VTWSPQSAPRDGTPAGGVRITLWHDLAASFAAAGNEGTRSEEVIRALGPLVMAYTGVQPFGVEFPGVGEDGIPEPLHYIHAVWLLLGTEIAAAGRGDVGRGTRRRVLKSIRHDQVTVITLRRPVHDRDTPGGQRDIDWSCRWIVRGFWRHLGGYGTIGHRHEGQGNGRGHCQACGGRVTWVRPYVKGPDDRPLKATQTLYRLSR
jgi:hypothetical protein